MEIRVLKYFLMVVREQSITRAAEVLHLTQPTLSRQLAQLEEEVGVKLFERGSRKIILTNEGILLRRRAEEIIKLVDKTEQELCEQEENIGGVITIGSGEFEGVAVLPQLCAAFRRKYPLVRYEIFTASADLVKEKMENGLLDLGLLLEPIDIEQYEFIRLHHKEHWVAVMRSDDPLCAQAVVRPEDLVTRELILPIRAKVQGELASWFGDYYDKLQMSINSNMSTNATILTEKGLGITITLAGAVPFLDAAKLRCIPLEPAMESTTVLAWKRQQPFGAATTKFIEHIKAFFGKQRDPAGPGA